MTKELAQVINLKLKEIDAIIHSCINKNIIPDKVCMDVMTKIGEIDEICRQNAVVADMQDYLSSIEKKLAKLCNILLVNHESSNDGDISVGDSFKEDHSIILTEQIKRELAEFFNE